MLRRMTLLRRLPMPLLAAMVGLCCGLLVWLVLELVQPKAVRTLLQKELERQQEERARVTLMRFQGHLQSHIATTRLLAHHRRLASYLEPIHWPPDREAAPIFHFQPPPWLPELASLSPQFAPSYLLLLDGRARLREVFQLSPRRLPEVLGRPTQQHPWVAGAGAYLTLIDGEPFLLATEPTEDATGTHMGTLLMAAVLDTPFLQQSQQGSEQGEVRIALLDADRQRLLVSSDAEHLPPGSPLQEVAGRYVATVQSFAAAVPIDHNLQFVTLIPHREADAPRDRILDLERMQRLFISAAYVLAFTLLLLLLSVRLNQVLRRISRFARRTLGFDQPVAGGSNELLVLEGWVWELIRTARRSRDEMLRRHNAEMLWSETLKDAIMEAALDSILTIDGSGGVVEVNRTAERVFGYRREEMLGRPFTELVVEGRSRGRFVRLLHGLADGSREARRAQAVDLRAIRADGRVMPVEVSIKPIQLEGKRYFTLYLHDISDRKRREQKIRLLAKFPGESPSPILRLDRSGTILYANSASQPLLGCWGVVPGQVLPADWLPLVAQVFVSGRHREMEITCGEQVFSLLLSPIHEYGYLNIFGREITSERLAEQKLREHQQELIHVSRLSTMGEMATGLAHELNQPLAAIANYANGCIRRIQNRIGDEEGLLEALRQIAKQADRSGEIIRRLRRLIGKKTPERSRADLNEVVLEVCAFMEFEARKAGVTIEQRLAAGELPVRIDYVQIEQVLLNLIRNALDALREAPAGRLSVQTGERGTDHFVVEVVDNGKGILPEDQAQIFEAFFTTKSHGMGVGLAISKTIAEDHDGRIEVQSEPGEGSRFTLLLPRASGAGATEEAEGTPDHQQEETRAS
jgi:two-component system, LuxR family, sensor kinase FixL